MYASGRTLLLLKDQVQSIREVVDARTGEVLQRMDYDTFGRLTLDTNPGLQPFGFAGGLHDPLTGLTRFGVRDYDPETGRFTARDPIGFAGGDTNTYRYAGNQPHRASDPTGRAIWMPIIAAAIVSGMASGGIYAGQWYGAIESDRKYGACSSRNFSVAGLASWVAAGAAAGFFSGLAAYAASTLVVAGPSLGSEVAYLLAHGSIHVLGGAIGGGVSEAVKSIGDSRVELTGRGIFINMAIGGAIGGVFGGFSASSTLTKETTGVVKVTYEAADIAGDALGTAGGDLWSSAY